MRSIMAKPSVSSTFSGLSEENCRDGMITVKKTVLTSRIPLFSLDCQRHIPDRMTVRIVHRADAAYPFLHDTVIAPLGGRLLMAWYNCTENEIAGITVIRGRWSDDGGKSWSGPEVIAESPDHSLHMVPAVFSEYNGEIRAYVTEMSGHDLPVGYVCLKYEAGRWQVMERRAEPVLFNTLPRQTPDGRWIAGGRMALMPGHKPDIPMIALARPASPACWTFTPLCGPLPDAPIPETAVIVGESRLVAFIRREYGPALTCASDDGGRTWSAPEDTGLPVAPSKMYGGTLPDGRQFLLFNELTAARDRSRLVLALGSTDEYRFERVWLLADGFNGTLNAGPFWHYPCACTANGCLYVSCTVSDAGGSAVRHAALFTIPLVSLR